MEALGIPGIDVQRWKKDWDGTQAFLAPEKYRFLSVATLSTHDTTSWNAWWEEESSRAEREDFWKYLGINGPVRETADPEMTGAALRFILKTRSLFSIQLIFDWLNLAGPGDPERVALRDKDIFTGGWSRLRINKPGTASRENWSVVIPVSLEDLLDHEVCGKIKILVAESNRLR